MLSNLMYMPLNILQDLEIPRSSIPQVRSWLGLGALDPGAHSLSTTTPFP